MANQLNNLQVMVTRPYPQGEGLCRYLEHGGAQVIHFPTLAFQAALDQDALKEAIVALGQQDWLIFMSPQAVYASVPDIRRQWPDFPPHVQFAAAGAGTAQALKHAGYLTAVHPGTEWNSEGLLALPEFQSVAGKKIAIIRGMDGRDLLAKILAQRGAQILHVIAYQRVLPEIDVSPYLRLIKEKQVDVIVCTSYEGVKNLKILLGHTTWPDLKNIPLLVVSERIKMLARDLGFQTIWVAHNAGHQAIAAALEQKRKELCQMKS